MRILLASPHRYPASGKNGSGLHPTKYPSGSGYHLHDLLAKGLAEEGHDVFYYCGDGGDLPLPLAIKLVPTPISAVDLCHAPICVKGFAESIQSFASERGKPLLLTCHLWEPSRAAAPNWVFVSRGLAREYGAKRVVLNGIDPNDFSFSETKQDYFLFMGAMDRAIGKGLDLALLLSRNKGFKLVVAGTGMTYETIRQVAELCRAAGAEYLGDVRGARKADLLAGAKAVLFPSRLNEGCPLIILEAMMSGTPVISSRCGGWIEVVTAGTGILCDTEDEWSAAIDNLSAISPKQCRKIALEKYHYRRMVKDYLQEYSREIGIS